MILSSLNLQLNKGGIVMIEITCKTLIEKHVLYQSTKALLEVCVKCPAAFECPDYIESNQLLRLLKIDLGIESEIKVRDQDRPDLDY